MSAGEYHCQHACGDGVVARRTVTEDINDGKVVKRTTRSLDAAGVCLDEKVEEVDLQAPVAFEKVTMQDAAARFDEFHQPAVRVKTPAELHAEKVAQIEHNEEEFEVKRYIVINAWEVIWVYFPKCPNGDKVMVYRANVVQWMNGKVSIIRDPANKRKRINPHFGRDDSPFARFTPTEMGWRAAMKFAEVME